ncbi:O-antigen ligase family protein [Candidatus Uhrbacteria bacterium]|nr:O-antigen ligase family protein [Candidatus Uhrbacteria bacterium]
MRQYSRDMWVRWGVAVIGFFLTWQTIFILRPGWQCWWEGDVCTPFPLATIGVQFVDAVLLFGAGVGMWQWWRDDRRSLFWVSGLLVVLMVSNVWVSVDRALTLIGWMRLVAFLFTLRSIPADAAWRRAFLGGFVVAMLAHASLGIAQFWTGNAWPSTLLGIAPHAAGTPGDAVLMIGRERFLRAYGGFPHPNILGTALLVGLIALLRLRDTTQRYGRLLMYASMLLLTMALVLTFSRAAVIGFVIFMVLLLRERATRALAVTGGIWCAVLLLIGAPFLSPRFTAAGANEQRSLMERRVGVQDAWLVWTRSPWMGVGLHAMPQALLRFARVDTQPVHNVPMLAMTEVGVIGVVVLVVLLVRFGLPVVRPSWEYLALLPSMLFDHHLWSLPVGLALLLVLMLRTPTPSSVHS